MSWCPTAGRCLPRPYRTGSREHRGSLTKNGTKLRWALIEVTPYAACHPAHADHCQHTVKRLGRQQGPKAARIEVAARWSRPSGPC